MLISTVWACRPPEDTAWSAAAAAASQMGWEPIWQPSSLRKYRVCSLGLFPEKCVSPVFVIGSSTGVVRSNVPTGSWAKEAPSACEILYCVRDLHGLVQPPVEGSLPLGGEGCSLTSVMKSLQSPTCGGKDGSNSECAGLLDFLFPGQPFFCLLVPRDVQNLSPALHPCDHGCSWGRFHWRRTSGTSSRRWVLEKIPGTALLVSSIISIEDIPETWDEVRSTWL